MKGVSADVKTHWSTLCIFTHNEDILELFVFWGGLLEDAGWDFILEFKISCRIWFDADTEMGSCYCGLIVNSRAATATYEVEFVFFEFCSSL